MTHRLPASRRSAATAFAGALLLLGPGTLAAASPPACTGEDLAAERKATVQRVFDEVLNRGEFELFATHYLPAFVKHVDGKDRTLEQEIRDARATRAIASDLVMSVDAMVAEGDLVAVRYTGRGTHDGPGLGMPPTGRSVALQGMTMYQFDGCKIAAEWTVYNALHLLEQIGLVPGAANEGG
jgi:predicted ester cyclase